MADNPIREKLQKRHLERLANMEKRREVRMKEKNESGESAAQFLEDFNKTKREIILALNSLDSTLPANVLATEFDTIAKKIQNLQKYVSDASMFLPSYDMRRAQEISTKIRSDINEKREKLLPKKKFTFKSRQKLKQLPKNETTLETSKVVSKETNILKNIQGFSDKSGETLSLSLLECNEKDINLSNLVDCVVHIYGYPSALRIQNVINSAIYCGPVSRSVCVLDCFDCTFNLACQQLRIHSTVNTKFHIHVTSKAIIEDCEDVGFACYKWQYPLLKEHFDKAQLDRETNNWEQIDDFDWLKLDEKSPNWYIIE